MTFFQNTLRIHGRILWHIPVTTDDFITNTGHGRQLYTRFTLFCASLRNILKIHGRVLWHEPVTTDDFITNTGHCRRLYNQYRSLPTTLYTSHTIMCESSEYTKNTRLCTKTGTGHDRRLYNQYYIYIYLFKKYLRPAAHIHQETLTNTGHCRRLYTRFTQLCVSPQNTLKIHGRVLWREPVTTDGFINVSHYYWGVGIVGIWYDDHGRALPTVRIIVPSSRRVSVRPNTTAQSISD